MAQWVKDVALSVLQPGLELWLQLGLCHRIFHLLQEQSKNKKTKKKKKNPNDIIFSWPDLQHMEVPGRGIQLELQLQAYTTATAIPDASCICNLRHSQILNPISKARDQTGIITDNMLGS